MIGIFFSVMIGLNAASIHWLGNYERARAEAEATGRVLMVLAVEPSSSASHRFLRDVLKEPRLIHRVNQRWVSVMVTHDYRSDYPNELYYTTTYPTLFWVDPRNELFVASPTAATLKALMQSLDTIKPLRRYP
jgi:hypothetical protein